MKEHFFFGYLYIKSSKVLAFISVIIGLGVCVSLLFDWRKTIEEKKYQSNPVLTASLQKLVSDYDNTKTQALELHSKLMISAQEKIELAEDPKFFDSYILADEFAELQTQVNSIQQNSEVLKKLVFKSFDQSVNALLETMRQHAISKNWMSKEEVKVEEKTQDEIPFRLFKVVDFSELKDRKKSLNEGMDFLSGLLKEADKEDSKTNITALTNHLGAYLNILNSIKVNIPLAPEAAEDDIITNKKRVFIVMDRLKFLKESVRSVVFDSWGLDLQYEKTSQLIQEELAKCLQAKEEVRQTISKYSFDLCWTVLISVVVTISILISSDLLKAVLLISLKNNKA